MTWKVIKIDGPMIKEIGLDIEYGVVISSDKMLERTQTLLYCPLISGVSKDGMLLDLMPWHVEVKIEDDKPGRLARVDYGNSICRPRSSCPSHAMKSISTARAAAGSKELRSAPRRSG